MEKPAPAPAKNPGTDRLRQRWYIFCHHSSALPDCSVLCFLSNSSLCLYPLPLDLANSCDSSFGTGNCFGVFFSDPSFYIRLYTDSQPILDIIFLGMACIPVVSHCCLFYYWGIYPAFPRQFALPAVQDLNTRFQGQSVGSPPRAPIMHLPPPLPALPDIEGPRPDGLICLELLASLLLLPSPPRHEGRILAYLSLSIRIARLAVLKLNLLGFSSGTCPVFFVLRC